MDEQNKRKSSRPKIKFSTTLKDGTVDSVELPPPSSMKVRRVATFVAGDLPTEQDVAALMLMMFTEPEVTFEYFSEYQQPLDQALNTGIDRGDILLLKSENYYYKHPKAERLYLLVPSVPPGGRELPEWKQRLVDMGPPFVKSTLSLSERKKREYEIWQKIEMEEAFREHRRKISYSYDIFLSYASEDRQEAIQIHDSILATGGKAFLAEKCIRPGDDFAEEIRLALNGSRELWLLISPHSIKSEWVISEWGAAWALKKKIIPILHRCGPESLPDRLKPLHCIDYYKYPDLIASTFPREQERE